MRELLVLIALGACGVDHAYVCAQDAQCGANGRCEADGFCAVADTTCAETGYRYVDSAPPDLAHTCARTCAADVYAGGESTCVRLVDNTVRCFGAAALDVTGGNWGDTGSGIFNGRQFTQIALGGRSARSNM